MTSERNRRYTPGEYLDIERAASFKSEFFDGVLFALAGGTDAHNAIAINIASELRAQLRDGPCRVYSSDMRLFIPVGDTSKYTYPDVAVVCDEPVFQTDRRDVLLNPTLIVEVLSESTEGYDRGKKFEHYRRIPSFTHYLLVSQTEARVDLYVRQPDRSWSLVEFAGVESSVPLEPFGCVLALSEVYLKIDGVA